ncbi:LysR family transcriptional regulator [Mannheimia sp. AT1]|uniref:LysR family transcriptional regulator n=1 Tax=Mannheimia cairinae TaxID=3025936 RepID=A0ABT5MRL2_9PAST|nr:LysR family transcriptional regulator [Mannheimia cairinae]MDD0824817.1 LysR family transcriptional regulator [Mannheimia cairinae]MDD0826253.1 LysR family transcriptional regulator [Mannheimia cairinae]
MRENYNDLYAFWLVAQEKNFTRAAQELGISPSALSKTIRLLEKRLGLQLFNRTTRTVALTQAGEQLFITAQKSFDNLNNGLDRLAHYREMPTGKIKVTAGLQIVQDILIPRLAHFKEQYPEIVLEFHAENQFVDIISQGFDAGVRLGDDVNEMMIAVKISQPIKMCMVGSPTLFEHYGFIKSINELSRFPSIGYVMSTGKLYEWELVEKGQTVKITPSAQFVCNDDNAIKTACLKGLGLAYLPQSLVQSELATGELISVLQPFCLSLPALYLYYPHRNISPALRVVIDNLKV